MKNETPFCCRQKSELWPTDHQSSTLTNFLQRLKTKCYQITIYRRKNIDFLKLEVFLLTKDKLFYFQFTNAAYIILSCLSTTGWRIDVLPNIQIVEYLPQIPLLCMSFILLLWRLEICMKLYKVNVFSNNETATKWLIIK